MHSAILPILTPLLAGFMLLLIKNHGINNQRILSVASLILLFGVSLSALLQVLQHHYIVYAIGGWEAPYGIVLVLDRLSILMVIATSLLAFGALWYAIVSDIDKKGAHFHVLFQLQLFGLNGAFLTGDLFNLFVFFEILLLASYSLLLHGKGNGRTKAGLHYVIINLAGSSLFLFAVGTLYGITGTLNIADLAGKISMLPNEDISIVAAAGLLLLVVFGLKAAVFPLYLWLPNAYSKTSAPVAALFAIMTKVGIYAIIRVHGTIFGDNAGGLANYYTPWLLYGGLLTLLLATFGVMSSKELKTQIAYLVLVSVSTLLISVGMHSVDAMSGTIYYMIHSTLTAGGFFLLADLIVRSRGKIGGKLIKAPFFEKGVLIGALFFVFAIAVASLPPLSGFFGKTMILFAAINHQQQGMIFSVILLSSLLVIITLAQTGSQLFYDTENSVEPLQANVTNNYMYPIVFLLAFAPLMVIFANPLTEFTQHTAEMMFDTHAYLDAVLNRSKGAH